MWAAAVVIGALVLTPAVIAVAGLVLPLVIVGLATFDAALGSSAMEKWTPAPTPIIPPAPNYTPAEEITMRSSSVSYDDPPPPDPDPNIEIDPPPDPPNGGGGGSDPRGPGNDYVPHDQN